MCVSDRGCADPKVGSTVKDFNKTTCFGLCQVAATHPFPYPPKSEQKDTGMRSFAPDKRLFFSSVNDPSAGSPTETLLRLLLPLNDKV